jgi:hypothetical protein
MRAGIPSRLMREQDDDRAFRHASGDRDCQLAIA